MPFSCGGLSGWLTLRRTRTGVAGFQADYEEKAYSFYLISAKLRENTEEITCNEDFFAPTLDHALFLDSDQRAVVNRVIFML